MRKKVHYGVLWGGYVIFAAILVVCKSPSSSQPADQVIADPSLANDIQSIFASTCTASSCHGSAASAGMTLVSGQAYANLVNVVSTQEPPKIRVVPNDANNSYLVVKIEGRQAVGGRMPLNGDSLSAARIQNIKNWIGQGAKNN